MKQDIVEARSITKQFFRKSREHARYFDAVSKADIVLHSGELCVLMGRSGCGKTTLLNMLAGLLQPTEGTVLACGQDLYKLDDARLARFRNEIFGVIPQGHTLLQSLTVLQNVILPMNMYTKDESSQTRALELLSKVGIDTLADAFPHELSGGEAKRVCIARALAGNPCAVFADEPTADLDDQSTKIVLELLRQTARQGAAVLLVTHEPAARDYADVLFTMDAGCVIPG